MSAPSAELAALVALVELVDQDAARPILRRAIVALAQALDAMPPAPSPPDPAVEAVRAAVASTGLSYTELGRRTGIQRSTVSKVLLGQATSGQTARLAAAVVALGLPLAGAGELVAWLAGQPGP